MNQLFRIRVLTLLLIFNSIWCFAQYTGNYTLTNGNWSSGSTWKIIPASTLGTPAQPVYIKNNLTLDVSSEVLIESGNYVVGSFGRNNISGGVYNYFNKTFYDSRIYYCQAVGNSCSPEQYQTSDPAKVLKSGDTIQYNGNLQVLGSFEPSIVSTDNKNFYNVCPVSSFYTNKNSNDVNLNKISKTWNVNESIQTRKTAFPISSSGTSVLTYPPDNFAVQVYDEVTSIAGLKNLISTSDPGGFKKLNIRKASGLTMPGMLDIRSLNRQLNQGTVVNFEGGATLNDAAKLIVRSGSTLVLGPSSCVVCEQSGSLMSSPQSAVKHEQTPSSDTWRIKNLVAPLTPITRPAVTAINTQNNDRIFPISVTVDPVNNDIVVKFNSAFAGYAIIRSYNYVLQGEMTEAERAKLCASQDTPCTRTRLTLDGLSNILVEPNALIKVYGNVKDVSGRGNNEINLQGQIEVIGDYEVLNTIVRTSFSLPGISDLTVSGNCPVITRGKIITTGVIKTGQADPATSNPKITIYDNPQNCPSDPSSLSEGCSSDDLGCSDFSVSTNPVGIVAVCGNTTKEIFGNKIQSKSNSGYNWKITWEGSNDASFSSPQILNKSYVYYLASNLSWQPATGNPMTLTANVNYQNLGVQAISKIVFDPAFPYKYVRFKLSYSLSPTSAALCPQTTLPVSIQVASSLSNYKIWVGKNISANPGGSPDWFDPNQWCPSGVPDLISNVFLAPGDLVTISGTTVGGAKVNSLTISGNNEFIADPAQLTISSVTNNVIVNGALTLNAGTNATPVGGKLTASGTTITFNDLITNYGTIAAKSGTLNFAGNFTNYGTVSNYGTSVFRFTGGTSSAAPAFLNNFGIFSATDYTSDPVNYPNAFTYFLKYTQVTSDPSAVLSFSRLNVGIDGSVSGYLKLNPGTTAKITQSILMPLNWSDFVGDGATFEFPSTSNSSIIPILAENKTFGNITIDRSSIPDYPSKVDLKNPLKVSGRISIREGLLITNNTNLTLLSAGDAVMSGGDTGILTSGDAQITQFGANGYISGDVTIQRKLDALTGSPPDHYYRYLGSAVSTTPSSITSDPVTGTNPYIKMLDSLYNPITPTSKIRPGKGFVYNSGSGETISLSGSLHGSLIPLYSNTIQATQGGDKTWGPFSTTGWKLIGNPYPSSIEWNYTDWLQSSPGSFASIMAISDAHVVGAYPAYFRYADNTAPSWGSGYVQQNVIAMGQGFWVYVQTPGATLTVKENAKTSTLGKFYRNGSGGNNPFDELQISLQDQFAADHIFLRTPNQNSSEQQLDTRDIGKLYNPNLNVYFSEGTNGALLIKYLAGDLKDISIPLGIDAKGAGTYTLRFEFSDYAPEGLKNLYLIDKIAGTSTMVSSQSIYSFDFPDASKPSEDRFILSSRPYIPAKEIEEFQVYPNPVSGQLTMKFPESLTVQTTIYSIRGELIYQDISSGGCVFDFGPLPSGIYLVNFKSERGNITRKIIRE